MSKRFLIVGAGVSGLTYADKLSQNGDEVVVIEREHEIGGLARTFIYDDHKFDSGPHWFYLNNPDFKDYMEDVLGDKIYGVKVKPGVFFVNKYYDWPLTISVIRKLPFRIMVGAIFDLLKVALSKPSQANNYYDLSLAKYGKTLFDLNFKPYTSKVTKTDLKEIHTDWSKIGLSRSVDEKPSMDSLFKVVISSLKPFKPGYAYYTQDGVGELATELSKRIRASNGKILTNTQVEEFKQKNGKITSVKLTGQESEAYDHIIWTAPISELSEMILKKKPKLEFITVILYNVIIKGKPAIDYQWCYYVDDQTVFNRICTTVLFSSTHAPDNYYGLSVEVTCKNNDSLEKKPETLIPRVIDDLLKTKAVINREDIINVYPEIMRNTYPLYTLDYRKQVSSSIKEIYKSCSNITLAGRTGLFWYSNMDHVVLDAFENIPYLLEGKRKPLNYDNW